MEYSIERLRFLYNHSGKHANYQILPDCLRPLMGNSKIKVISRHEKERLNFVLQYIDPAGKSILDIGGNTGYFSFEMLERNAAHVDYYEGNVYHAEFVSIASELLKYPEKIHVYNEYFNFQKTLHKKYDIGFLLNVLHHAGDDYGDKGLTIEMAKKSIIENLNRLSSHIKTLVFQLGFCWKGDKDLLFFTNGTKSEMVNFIRKGLKNEWNIEAIGIPGLSEKGLVYSTPSRTNMERIDKIGEFLNRPLFILKSLK